jgi:hypothetical protein
LDHRRFGVRPATAANKPSIENFKEVTANRVFIKEIALDIQALSLPAAAD